MLAMPGLRAFSLAAARGIGGVSCDAQGVFIGDVPLLRDAGAESGNACWTIRPLAKLNEELTVLYQLPVDVTAKAGALALIANAFNRGDLALAAIAVVQMQFPNPPPLAKRVETDEEIKRRAYELYRSGLLKAGWDPAKHPRTGTPPNPGWFAPAANGSEAPVPAAMGDKPWKKPDLPGGFGGGGGGGSGSQPKLPFPGGLPETLPPYVPGGKTYGILQTPTGNTVLQSGSQGPAADIPPGSAGFEWVTRLHVEGQAAALMWQQGTTEGTLYINNPEICVSCMSLLPRMLPPGSTLNVVLPDDTVMQFKGITR